MPVVPDISLGVVHPDMGGSSPLSTVGSAVDIANKIQQNQLLRNQALIFQQQFAAKQKMGQIMSQAPDIESGLAAAAKDPLAAPFAGEVMNSYREAALALQRLQGEQQTQSESGMQAVLKGIGAGMGDPSMLMPTIEAQLKTLSPTARARVQPAISGLVKALTEGLPEDKTQARAVFNQRLVGIGIGSGVMSGEAINGILGKPTSEDTGSGTLFGTQLPAQLGGGFQQAPGSALVKGVAPSVSVSPAGGTTLDPGVKGGMEGSPGIGGPANGLTTSTPAPAAPAASPLPPNPVSGRPPEISPDDLRAPGVSPGRNSLPVSGELINQSGKDLLGEYAKEGANQFKAAQQGIGTISLMSNDFDALAKGGANWQQPGTLGDLRNGFAKTANTIAQLTGEKLPFDPQKTASWEDLTKNTGRLALMVTNQFLGGQREAASTIQGIAKTVPNIENTYMGAKLVMESLKSSMQRVIDERAFDNAWLADPKNGGNLTGADVKFNQLYPAKDYAQHTLDKFGLTPDGFKNKASIAKALESGFLTRKEANDIYSKQFGGK